MQDLVSGGLNPYSPRADRHADMMYEAIRRRSTDYLVIAKNTGFTIEQVQIIKNYLFKDKHYLKGSTLTSRFDPTFEIAESWRRLSEKGGKNIKSHDVLLLHHELYEIMLLLTDKNMSQNRAHILATDKYNYQLESEKFYGIR